MEGIAARSFNGETEKSETLIRIKRSFSIRVRVLFLRLAVVVKSLIVDLEATEKVNVFFSILTSTPELSEIVVYCHCHCYVWEKKL